MNRARLAVRRILTRFFLSGPECYASMIIIIFKLVSYKGLDENVGGKGALFVFSEFPYCDSHNGSNPAHGYIVSPFL